MGTYSVLSKKLELGQKTASFFSGTFTTVTLVPEGKDSRGKGGKVVQRAVTHWRRGQGQTAGWGVLVVWGWASLHFIFFRNYIPVFFGKLTFHLTSVCGLCGLVLPQLQWCADQCLWSHFPGYSGCFWDGHLTQLETFTRSIRGWRQVPFSAGLARSRVAAAIAQICEGCLTDSAALVEENGA